MQRRLKHSWCLQLLQEACTCPWIMEGITKKIKQSSTPKKEVVRHLICLLTALHNGVSLSKVNTVFSPEQCYGKCCHLVLLKAGILIYGLTLTVAKISRSFSFYFSSGHSNILSLGFEHLTGMCRIGSSDFIQPLSKKRLMLPTQKSKSPLECPMFLHWFPISISFHINEGRAVISLN